MSVGINKNNSNGARSKSRNGKNESGGSKRPTRQQTDKTKQKPKTKVEDMDFEEDEDDEVELDSASQKSSKKVDPKVIGIAAVGVGIVVVGCMLFLGNDNTESDPTLNTAHEVVEDMVEEAQPDVITDKEGNPIYDSNGNVIGEDAINPGYVTDLANESDGTVPAQIFDADDYIEDLNGVPISGSYNVESIDIVKDYVSYEIRRAIIDGGMEMYWAEIDYEGKKYRAQMSYSRASKFKPKGIATAQIEVLNIVGGGKVISYISMETE